MLRRAYATIAPSSFEGGAIKIDPSIHRQLTVKPPTSKKSLLHAEYTSFIKGNKEMLILQHNNLTQSQLIRLRTELKGIGARLRIIRVGIFQHALRVAQLQSEGIMEDTDVNSIAISKESKLAAKKGRPGLDITQLLTGPVCTITFKDANPEALKKTIDIISSTRSQLLLLGGKFEDRVFTVPQLQGITKLPSLSTLQGQLLSLLGSPTSKLTQILASPASRISRLLSSI